MPALEEKIQQATEYLAAETVAAAIPLPGPAGDAFASGPIVVGGHSIRKIVRYDWRVWQMTDSAIIRAMASLDKPDAAVPMDDDSAAVAIWMLTHSCADVQAALKPGVQAFKDKCVLEIEAQEEAPQFDDLFDAVMEQVKRSCATAIQHAMKADGEGEKKNFRVVPATE